MPNDTEYNANLTAETMHELRALPMLSNLNLARVAEDVDTEAIIELFAFSNLTFLQLPPVQLLLDSDGALLQINSAAIHNVAAGLHFNL